MEITRHSYGILLFRRAPEIEVLLTLPGSPVWWPRKDEDIWGIPKGLGDPGEDHLVAAKREFEEEIGVPAPDITYTRFTTYQVRDKQVTVFVGEVSADEDISFKGSNQFELEWPAGSGQTQWYDEIDDAQWMKLGDAMDKVIRSQKNMLIQFANSFTE